MRALGTRGKRVRSIQRDQSVSSGTQRPVVVEPIIGYAFAIDGVPLLTHRLNSHSAVASTDKAQWCHCGGL